MSTDPAVEAQHRARHYRAEHSWANRCSGLDAAREALAPLRELHHKVSKRNGWTGHFEDICLDCQDQWPCTTAVHCYTSEELT